MNRAVTRTQPDKTTLNELVRFYRGKVCVLTGQEGSYHHLNGVPQPSRFEDLIPLSTDLHMPLRPRHKGRGKEHKASIPGKLEPPRLREAAIALYRNGQSARAVGCGRLAHSIRRYFMQEDADDELLSATLALLYLRRYIGAPPELGYRLAHHMIREEILPTLRQGPLLSPKTTILLAQELASWMNEQGRPLDGLPVLARASSLLNSKYKRLVEPDEASRIMRQLAHSFILTGEPTAKVENLLQKAEDYDDSNHNAYGVTNARILLWLDRKNYTAARDILESRWEVEEKRTHGFLDPIEMVGTSYDSFFGYLALSIITQSYWQDRLSDKKLREKLEILFEVEKIAGQNAKLILTDNLKRTGEEAFHRFPDSQGFISSHTVSSIPDYVARAIREASAILEPALSWRRIGRIN